MNTLSLVIAAGLLLGILVFCGWVIKRHFVDRRWLSDGSRFIGTSVYSQWQNADEQDRIEYVRYVQEDEREEALTGEPGSSDEGPGKGVP